MAMDLESEFYQGGQRRYDHTPGSDIANGTILNLGTGMAGIVTTPGGLEANRMGSVAVSGTFKIKKAAGAGVTFARGVKVEWNDTTKLAVAAAAGDFALGVAAYAAADADDYVIVELNQQHPAAT